LIVKAVAPEMATATRAARENFIATVGVVTEEVSEVDDVDTPVVVVVA